MVSRIRIALVLVVCLLLAALIGLGRWQANRQADSAGAALSHESCRQCHPAVWKQWEASFHSRAWSDPNVQAAFKHFGFDRKCQSCHAPQPVLTTGLTKPVELRERQRQSGVNCLSCHYLADRRGVAARHTIADAPCRPVQRPELTGSRICGACHDAIHQDWRKSRFRTEVSVNGEKTCQDCHMPTIADRQRGRSHLCLGGHHAATVRRGVRMSCRRQGGELIVSVTNHATGHNFPGERHNRVLHVQVFQQNAVGEIILAQQELIKGITPFRGESSADEIRAGQTFEARFPIVEPPVVTDVRLLYRAFPWLTDRDALLVHHLKLNLEKLNHEDGP